MLWRTSGDHTCGPREGGGPEWREGVAFRTAMQQPHARLIIDGGIVTN